MNAPQQFTVAEPFPHLVIDDFLPAALLADAAASFDEVPVDAWVHYDREHDRGKRTCHLLDAMPAATANLLRFLSSNSAAQIAGALTGLDGLQGDPSLYGAGLHETSPSGFLGLHADNEIHPTTGLLRRLNLVVYCTPAWREEWGGELEFWNRDASRCVQRIAPRFNRAVLFTTATGNIHGHPTPLACPLGVRRRSLAVFFWGQPQRRARFLPDSLDCDQPGHAEHNLSEAKLCLPQITPAGMIACDDTWWENGWQGKGALTVPWLLDNGWAIVHSGWQTVLMRRPSP